MTVKGDGNRDSVREEGGTIPGAPDVPAFALLGPDPSAIPVLIAVPHAGRAYPAAVLERMRHPGHAALRLEDRYVDRLGDAMARETGAALLVANAPRAMLDLNRSADDIDWEMLGPTLRDRRAEAPQRAVPGQRARSGLGLIPRRLPGLGELWKRRIDRAELDARIAGIHAPYHDRLGAALEALRERWGAALLIDLHSMPPLAARSGTLPAEFVIGDRFGAACDGALIASAFGYFGEMRRGAAHNRPYAGGYVLERHGRPRRGVHALQLEVDRLSYLDAAMAEPGKGFAAMVALLSGLVRRLAADVAALGQGGQGRDAGQWADAAE